MVGKAGTVGKVPLQIRFTRYEPNPSGLQLGFWNGTGSKFALDGLKLFGRRPVTRNGFHSWRSVEKTPGQYDFSGVVLQYTREHLCGSTVVGSFNLISTPQINPNGSSCIPSFYEQDIKDRKTRAAALRAVDAYIRAVLPEVGSLYLCFDYEFLWFFNPVTPERRETYAEWYHEAARTARAAARAIGQEEQLKLICIPNTNPLETAGKLIGGSGMPDHQAQNWLLDVVKDSDIFGFDSYAHDASNRKSPQPVLDVLNFWRTYYSGSRPVFITESGFSSVLEEDPKYRSGYQGRGTEQEQAAFLDGLLQSVAENNRNGRGRDAVRALIFWMLKDDPKIPKDRLEQLFGVVRADGTMKPAGEALRKRIREVETDPVTRPFRAVKTSDVSDSFSPGSVTVNFEAGDQFETLSFSVPGLSGQSALLEVDRKGPPGEILVQIDGTIWISTQEIPLDRRNRLDLTPWLCGGDPHEVSLCFTGPHFPWKQKVSGISLFTN